MSTSEGVASLWLRFKPLIASRIELLERYAGGDPEVSREEAASAAHKLAGALGSYGRHQGTQAARDVENLLEQDATGTSERLRRAITQLRDATQT